MDQKNIPDVRKNLRQALLGSVLVPVLVLAFFLAAPHWLDRKLRGQITESIANSAVSPAVKAARLDKVAHLNIRQVCEDCPPGMEAFHNKLVQSGVAANFQRLHWGLLGAWLLVGIVALAVGAIFLLNGQAQKSRDDLIRSYQLGWKISMAAALAKVFLLIPLLAYGSFEFTILLGDRYYPQLLFVIVLGGVFAIWKSAAILLKPVPLEFTEPMAREVTPADAPELWAAVRHAAGRLQTSPPDRILTGLQLNFYVTELAVKHDGGRTEGKTLYLSFPLLKQLSGDEVLAIIGHELGHFIGEDTRLTREFYPLRLKAQATRVAMARSGWVGWPSFQLLNCFTWCFSATEQAASRQRELLADQKAAELTAPATAAHALVRFQVACAAFQRGLKEAVKDKAQNPLDISLQTIVQEKLAPDAAFWAQLFEQKLPHPLDSHPTLQVRLEALGQMMSVEQAQAIALTPSASAYEHWLAGHAALFSGLTQQAQAAVEKLRARSEVTAADYQTEAGKQLLDQHFPEKQWMAKPPVTPWIIAGLFGCFFVAMAIIVDNLTARLIFGALLAFLGAGMFVFWKSRHKGELVLNAEGVSYTGWQRPLRFADVQKITGQRQYANIILTFHWKSKQPPLRKFTLLRFASKRATLSVGGFDGKPLTIAETVVKYFARHTGK